jgi:hypothetical protein
MSIRGSDDNFEDNGLPFHAIHSGKFDQALQQQCSKHGPVAIEALVKKLKTHVY